MASRHALRFSLIGGLPIQMPALTALSLEDTASQNSMAQFFAGCGNYAGLYRLPPCNVFNLLFLLFLLPALVLLACAVKLTSDGPVVVCTERLSHTGKMTRLFRFRTTDIQNPSKYTFIGRRLHRSALDQLPMLWTTWARP
jgi:sugar transferase